MALFMQFKQKKFLVSFSFYYRCKSILKYINSVHLSLYGMDLCGNSKSFNNLVVNYFIDFINHTVLMISSTIMIACLSKSW